MYQSILVGTDGSPSATLAVEQAGSLAAEQGAELHIASAYGDPESSAKTPEGLVSNTNLVLEEARKLVAELGVDATKHVLEVEPSEGLCDLAVGIGADLIIVGNRGLGGVQGYFLGSVPAKVVREAPCAVLVVKTT